jgi:hypothetical protein
MKCCSLFLILQAGVQLKLANQCFKDRLDGYQTLELSMKYAADWMKPNSQRKMSCRSEA